METITDIRNGKVWMFRLLNDAETAEPISIKFDQRFDWDYGLSNFLRIMTKQVGVSFLYISTFVLLILYIPTYIFFDKKRHCKIFVAQTDKVEKTC